MNKMNISRRELIRLGIGSSIALTLGSCSREKVGSIDETNRPNIVLIILDALRASSLPMYGCPRNTAPFLKKISKQSTLFKRCYTSATWTKPAIAGMLTGLTPIEHGITQTDSCIPHDMETFPKDLHALGYKTGFFTANPFTGQGYGLNTHFDHASFEAAAKADGYIAISECEKWLKELEPGPVFVLMHIFQPHAPYNPPQAYIDQILEEAKRYPPSSQHLWHHHREVDVAAASFNILGRTPLYEAVDSFSLNPLYYLLLYEANILLADTLASHFLSRWNHLRVNSRTVFIITSDHGEGLGEHGLFYNHRILLANPILQVPLLVYDTANLVPREVDTLASHLDLPSSILDLAGYPKTPGRFDRKIFNFNERQTLLGDRVIVSQEVPRGDGVPRNQYDPGYAITKGDWRLVYNDYACLGKHALLDITTEARSSSLQKRGPIPIPSTALRCPKEISPGVSLLSLAIHSPYIELGQSYSFSGEICLSPTIAGVLSLRLRVPGSDPIHLIEIECRSTKVEINGLLPAFSVVTVPKNKICLFEALWKTAGSQVIPNSSSQNDPPWQKLFSFPLFRPQNISPDLQLIGVHLEPSTAYSGQTISATLIWRCLKNLQKSPTISIELLDPNGEVVDKYEHSFFKELFSIKKRISPPDLLQNGLRSEQNLRISIPSNSIPGTYHFKINDKTSVTAADFQVCENAQKALLNILDREEDLTNFNLRSILESENMKNLSTLSNNLNRLSQRFPEEGEPKYLLAMSSEDANERQGFIRQCLDRTSFHLQALILAVKESLGKDSKTTLDRLTPGHACDFNFQELIRLYGYDLLRSPTDDNAVYLKLHWEILAPIAKLYGVELDLHSLTPDTSENRTLFWFLGANLHPPYEWKTGEAMVETINLPLLPNQRKLVLSLNVYPYWDYAYAGLLGDKPCLTIINAEKNILSEAQLGPFKLDELPVHDQDLLAKKRQNRDYYKLFYLPDDPFEQNNVAEQNPEIFREFQLELLSQMNECQSNAKITKSATIEISEELSEKLQGMGYLK